MKTTTKRTRRFAALGVIAACMVMVTACGSSAKGSAPTTAAPVATDSVAPASTDVATTEAPTTVPVAVEKIRLTVNDGLVQNLPQHVAIDQGFFKQNALDVSLVSVPSGPAAVQAVLGGNADVMINAPDFVILAGQTGNPMQIFCGNLTSANTTLIVSNKWALPHKGSYPAVVGDLKGAKIGVVARGSFVENQLRVMLTDAGLDPDKDVTIIATGVLPTAIPALQTGQVDAWVGFEPGTTIALEQLKLGVSIVDFRKGEGPKNLSNINQNAYAAKVDYIKAHTDALKRFSLAMSETFKWMKDPANRDALNAIAAKYVTADASLIPTLMAANVDTFGADVTQEKIQNSIDQMLKFKLITTAPSFGDIVATDLLPQG